MNINSEIDKFRKDWKIDFTEKMIKRSKSNLFTSLQEVIWKPKYPVIALYRFAQYHLASEAGIVWPNFIERGKGNEVAGVPAWFELSTEWAIPKKDLAFLYLGPLVQGETILVSAFPEKGFFTSVWQLISGLATVGGAIGFIVLVFKFGQWVLCNNA